jgi:hypothetical protein
VVVSGPLGGGYEVEFGIVEGSPVPASGSDPGLVFAVMVIEAMMAAVRKAAPSPAPAMILVRRFNRWNRGVTACGPGGGAVVSSSWVVRLRGGAGSVIGVSVGGDGVVVVGAVSVTGAGAGAGVVGVAGVVVWRAAPWATTSLG